MLSPGATYLSEGTQPHFEQNILLVHDYIASCNRKHSKDDDRASSLLLGEIPVRT